MRGKGVPHAVKGNDFGDASPGAGLFKYFLECPFCNWAISHGIFKHVFSRKIEFFVVVQLNDQSFGQGCNAIFSAFALFDQNHPQFIIYMYIDLGDQFRLGIGIDCGFFLLNRWALLQ